MKQGMGVGLESRVQVERLPGTGQRETLFPSRTERRKMAIALIRGLRDQEKRFEEVLVGLKSRYKGSKYIYSLKFRLL